MYKKKINDYEVNENLTPEILLANNFKLYNGKEESYYVCILRLEHNLNLNIYIDLNMKLKEITVTDEDFGQPYIPFYTDQGSKLSNQIIDRYNEEMEKLVQGKVFSRKKIFKLNERYTTKLSKNRKAVLET